MKIVLNGNFVATNNALSPVTNQSADLIHALMSGLGAKPGEVLVISVSAEHSHQPNWVQCKGKVGDAKYSWGCGNYFPPNGTCPNIDKHFIAEPDGVAVAK